MRTFLGGLDTWVEQADKNRAPRAAIVLCHGFGASGEDLVGLAAPLLKLAPELSDVRFYFPAAPLDLSRMGAPGSRAWWMISQQMLEDRSAADPATVQRILDSEPEGLKPARHAFTSFIEAASKDCKLGLEHFVLGGFSQGAMLTTDFSLRSEQSPGGLVILSGTLLAAQIWQKKAAARTALPVFAAHGKSDPILPFAIAERLQDLFKHAGISSEFHSFQGAHEIPPAVIAALAAWLTERIRGLRTLA